VATGGKSPKGTSLRVFPVSDKLSPKITRLFIAAVDAKQLSISKVVSKTECEDTFLLIKFIIPFHTFI
jgi:hypothetical protein